jgi:hypothetical protein
MTQRHYAYAYPRGNFGDDPSQVYAARIVGRDEAESLGRALQALRDKSMIGAWGVHPEDCNDLPGECLPVRTTPQFLSGIVYRKQFGIASIAIASATHVVVPVGALAERMAS